MHACEADHRDPRNQACHEIGIPLIAASLPVGAPLVDLPLAATIFTTGWTFQFNAGRPSPAPLGPHWTPSSRAGLRPIRFIGHAFEGKKPSFVDDERNLIVSLLWWTKKMGVGVELATADRKASA